jgi:hypothetical protein
MSLEIKGNFHNQKGKINFNLPVITFQENEVYFFYTPALDLTGYGKTEEEARTSFQETLGQFLDYTTNKKTLFEELKKLGWKVKKNSLVVPSLKDMIIENNYLAEIFEEKAYTKFHHTISLPAIA